MVYVVDDDPAVRDSLVWLLESESIPTREFASASEFLHQYRPDWHGCVVLDVRMPGMSGLELQERLADSDSSLPIIVVTGHAEVPMAIRAMKAGAFDFIEKPFSDEAMLDCIRRAIAAENLASEERDYDSEIFARYQTLTPREREVMRLVSEGRANKVIAADLQVSAKTVEVHRSRLMSKMRARSISDLVRQAIVLEQRSEWESSD